MHRVLEPGFCWARVELSIGRRTLPKDLWARSRYSARRAARLAVDLRLEGTTRTKHEASQIQAKRHLPSRHCARTAAPNRLVPVKVKARSHLLRGLPSRSRRGRTEGVQNAM